MNTSVFSSLQERERTGKPVRVGVIGAGATGRAVALQLGTPVPGMRMVAICNRTVPTGERALREAGFSGWVHAESTREAEEAINRGLTVLAHDPLVLTQCGAIDVILEVTGTTEPAARAVLSAFDHGKHVVRSEEHTSELQSHSFIS